MFQDMWNPFLKKRALEEVDTRRHRSSTFTEPLRKAPEMKDFLTTFYKNVYTPAKKSFYNQELKTHSDSLKVHYDILVPTMVSYEDFWQRYEWRCDINRVTNELRQADAIKANNPPKSPSKTTSQSKSSPLQTTPFTTSTPETAGSGWTNWLSESPVVAPLVKSDPIRKVPHNVETMAQISNATNEKPNATKLPADSSKLPSDGRSSSKQGDTTKGPSQGPNKRKENVSNETKSKSKESSTTADSSASTGPLSKIREAIKEAMQPTTTDSNAEPSPDSSSKQMNPIKEEPSTEATKTSSADPTLSKNAAPASLQKTSNFFWPGSLSKPSSIPKKEKEAPSVEATKTNSVDTSLLKNARLASPNKTSYWFGKKQSNVATVAPVVSQEKSQVTPLDSVDKTAPPLTWSKFLMFTLVVMVVFLSSVIVIFFFSPLDSPWRQMTANGMCGPVPPGTVLDSASTLLVSGESMAPWWAPDPLKEQSFALFCGTRPRVHLKWHIVGNKKQLQLTATNMDNGKTILNLQGLASVEILASQIRSQTLKHKLEDRSAPWIAAAPDA
jgi:hypothetical protein